MRQMIISTLSNKTDFENWFGKFITENHHNYEEEQATLNETEFYTQLKKVGALIRYGNIRFSYIQNDTQISFFYAGNTLALSKQYFPLVAYLCRRHSVDYQHLIEMNNETLALPLLYTLYRDGCFYFDE